MRTNPIDELPTANEKSGQVSTLDTTSTSMTFPIPPNINHQII